MSPKKEISEIRREELTLAAMKCIALKGYDRVTLDDVTTEAGLSKGISTYYFKNREELLNSVIQRMWQNIVDITRGIWNLPDKIEEEKKVYAQVKKYYSDPNIDLREVIRDGIKFLLVWFDENHLVLKVVLEFWCQIPRNPMISKLFQFTEPYFRNISMIIIKEGISRGVFKKRDPKRAAYVLTTAISGFAFTQVVNSGEYNHKALENDLCDFVFGYLLI